MNTFANSKLLGKSEKKNKNEHFRVENKINEKKNGHQEKRISYMAVNKRKTRRKISIYS